jgi:hypothetical protein
MTDAVPEDGTWFVVPPRPSAEEIRCEYVTRHGRVEELAKYATAAHRSQRGNIIWMCWQPGGAGSKPSRVSSPSSGTTLVMLSAL